MKTVVLIFLALLVLHQDFWNWSNNTLFFEFLPAGLAYHIAFSLLAAALGALAIHRIWPAEKVDREE